MAYCTQADLETRIGSKNLAEWTNDNPYLYTFTVSGVTTTPTAGAIYTNNAQTFTVVSASLSGTPGALAGTVICTYTGVASSSGALTKSSGTGDATITFSAATAADTSVVSALILRADTFINNALNGIYDVPFQAGSLSAVTTPVLVNKISTDLACFWIMQRRPTSFEITKDWNNVYKDCLDAIDRLANLDDVLNDAKPIYTEGVMTPATTSPVIDFNDTSNNVSWF